MAPFLYKRREEKVLERRVSYWAGVGVRGGREFMTSWTVKSFNSETWLIVKSLFLTLLKIEKSTKLDKSGIYLVF